MKTNILAINTNMKNVVKYFCAVLLVIVTSAHAWGQAPSLEILEKVEISASNFTNYNPGGANGASVSGITVATTNNYKNTCNDKPYIRLNSSSTMTISVTSGAITQVHFSPMATGSCGGNGMVGKFSAPSGNISEAIWTHPTGVSSITFTATSTADFRSFTVYVKKTTGDCPFTFPTSIAMTVATGDIEDYEVTCTGTTGYTLRSWSVGLSNYDLGGGEDDSELSSYSSMPSTISVMGEVPGTYYGTFDFAYDRMSPYSSYEIRIPITVTVTGCLDISDEDITFHDGTPAFNCSTGKWEITTSWDAVPGATRYGVALVEYNPSTSKYDITAVAASYQTGTSKTYTVLESNTKYKVAVQAQNEDCIPAGKSKNVTTLQGSSRIETTCPSVTAPTVTAVPLSHTANVSWSSASTTCDNTYTVSITKHSNGASVYSQTTSATTNVALGTPTPLESNTRYDVSVTAQNGCGSASTTTETYFTTAKELVDYRYMCIDLDLKHTDYATDNSAIKITSAAGQAVKGSRTLTLSIDGASANAVVNISGTDLQFYKADGTLITSDNLTCDPSGDMDEVLHVAYAPSAYSSESFATPTINVSCDGNNLSFANMVTGRCLPDQFVIAAKAGNEWVALTAKISKMSTQDAIPIKVDNTITPTKASIAMNTSEYSLLGLSSTLPNAASNRLKMNGTAAYFHSSITGKVLNATKSTSTKTSISTSATATNAASSDSCLYYEWKLVSTDLVHYTITNSNDAVGLASNRILGYNLSSGKWGMYASGSGTNQDIFLLPIETVITDMEAEVMEWGTTSIALRIPGTAPSNVVVTLGGSPSGSKALTSLATGSDMYKVEGLTLTSNDCEVMMIADAADASKGTLVRKPILVSEEDAVGSDYTASPGRDVCTSCDIVILNGGKLTADEAKTTGNHVDFANIYVYPGGKLVLDAKSLGVKQQVYVRGGYSWLNQNTYALPELYISGNINFNGSAKIIYDYYIHNYQYYQFCLPYTVPLAKVTDEAGIDNFPVWVKHYNGALRAANANATSWDWYEGTNFEAGVGYIIAARPRQVEKVQNRPLSIIRFPLTNNAFTGNSTADYGEAQKSVSTTAHGIAGYEAGTVTANNVGWNLIGNPYMATWKGDIGHKQLEKDPDAEHWNGSYHWADAATKYITVMEPEDGTDYDQYVASTKELKPFFPFFFQETAEGGNGTLTFSLGNRIKKAPAAVSADAPREAFVQIDMMDGTSQDQTGVYVGDKYSDELDFDDMQKMFGSLTTKPKIWIMHDETRMAFEAMSEERAASNVPVGYRAPVDGEFTFTLSNYSKLENVESVLLNDNELGIYNYDLLSSDYVFESGTVLYNDTRFTLRIVLKDENAETPTGTETIYLNSEEPLKFIYHDKMYILRGGVIYDATGKQVKEVRL